MPISNNLEVSRIELLEAKYEIISNENIKNIQNLENIPEIPEAKAWMSIARHQSFLNFELVPLRRNKNTGTIERLVYFNYKVTYSPVTSQKSQKNRNYASNSKLSDGKWYKIKVYEEGMYKLTYSQLIQMGFSNFNNIGVFGYGGMLSKVIVSGNYTDDLPEIPVYKVDVNSNSIFDEGDYLVFYADGPNNIYYDNLTEKFSHELHNYSECSYYFISDKGTWKQPYSESSAQNPNVTVNTYDEYKFLEKDSLNLISSGRTLFWRLFDDKIIHNFSQTYSNVSLSDNVNVTVVMAGQSTQTSSFNITFNGTSSPVAIIESTSSGSIVAKLKTLSEDFRTTSNTFNLQIKYNKSTSNSKAWLDYVSFQFRRNLNLNEGFLHFRDSKSVGTNQIAKFVITNATSNAVVWDITNRTNIFRINGEYISSNSKYEFSANSTELREYIAFNPYANFPSPVINGSSDVGHIQNQNLHAAGHVDLIIVYYPDFYSQALGIKSLHEQHDGLKVVMATPQMIYNEFSSGCPDVSAIRNYVKMFYDRAGESTNLPKNLLLFGDGSYDNLGNKSLILTYQSKESLWPSSSFVSDDFYVYMDIGEGSLDNNQHDLDLGVGRITVNTTEEAENYLNKARSYYSKDSYSNWKNNILLVADDAEKGEVSFQEETNNISMSLRLNNPLYNVETIYLDDYEQISTVQGHRYPAVSQAMNDVINNGVLIVNWIGHANSKGWAEELVLDIPGIKSWRNTNKYPIFMTGTCEFAPFDLHNIVSAGEEALLHPTGGAIALFTTTRKVYGSAGEALSKEFFKHIVPNDFSSEVNSLGITVMKTKNGVPKTTANRNDFTLIGDPALIPPVPRINIRTTKINGFAVESYTDTINAKTLVSFEGVVEYENGSVAEDFNGIVYPTVYDKFMTYTTRGNDGYGKLTYQSQKNIIFKGQASVKNGRFSFSFIVPVDIAYFFDTGKISYYATNNINNEAAGYFDNFLIGGSGNDQINDSDGPVIDLFMNDEQFISGGITDENPILLANISDNSGINTTSNGIGHDITLIIDENTSNTIVLNKFYESVIDDFTSGNLKYPISELTLGPHTLKVKAWDVFNNSSEKSIDFIVASSSELIIDHIFNYPNPFSTNTHFYLAHNQPNIQLDVLIQIFTVSGKHVKTIRADVLSEGFRSQPIHWDGRDEYGDKIARGVYIYKLAVKAPNGNTVEKFEKLMILN
ncbi:MAG: type IX secretion system sortase PorU [Bacteroidales bacterium]|nr:type IX secretion system sortase PorU [Bacteroidales bacterium]